MWLLDRRGGEAERLTDVKGGVEDFGWAPDARRLAIVATDDPDSAKTGEPDSVASRPKPIVIDRYLFKDDGRGYLTHARSHLFLSDVASKKLERLTDGDFDDEAPAWSPDGTRIAFVSKRDALPDPDRNDNTDVFVIQATPGATPRRLTTFDGPDGGPLAWSPDGTRLAFVEGSPPRFYTTRTTARRAPSSLRAAAVTDRRTAGVSSRIRRARAA